jgi:hypothetical protein
MDFRPTHVYLLTADKLRELCAEVGVESEGTVQVLRRRLVQFLRDDTEGNPRDQIMDDTARADAVEGTPPAEDQTQVGQADSCVPVLVELLRKVSPLTASEPEEVMKLFIKLNVIHRLRLVSDKVIMTRVLPLLIGDVLILLGESLRQGNSWEQFLSVIRERIFTHFVRERLVRDLVVNKMQGERAPLREHIDGVFSSAEFLGYQASEQELVDRVVTNLHPSILSHAALLNRPRSRVELLELVGIIEERISVRTGRPLGHPTKAPDDGKFNPPLRNSSRGTSSTKCWNCGRLGHVKRDCRSRPSPSGNGAAPGGVASPPGRVS